MTRITTTELADGLAQLARSQEQMAAALKTLIANQQHMAERIDALQPSKIIEELEAALEVGTLMQLVERFESGAFSTRDVLALVVAGLRGGGWQGQAADLRTVEIAGGPVVAARAAAQLLARAFALPGE